MRLREWDPGAAPAAEITAWVRAYNNALTVDLPDDPPWTEDRMRDYLTETMPGERRLTWIMESDDGTEILGYGRLLVMSDLGVLELFVVPAARRSGAGVALLTAIAKRAVAEGFNSIGVEVSGGAASAGFYLAHGFSLAYSEMRSILDLDTVNWAEIAEMAAGVVHGYRLEFHAGDLPDEMLAAYAEAKQVRRLDPTGELDLRPSSYDPERLRASLRCLQARGLRPYIVVAIHDRSGKVAALTELVVPAHHRTRGDQYDTVIVPEHNGYGLARAIKARMLIELRTAEPQLRDVQTWHATDREPLHQVNKELGFRPDREWREYEVDTADLAVRLGV